jgi:hypothetical protein
MALESSGARIEQLARQMFAYGRPVPMSEIVAKVDAVTVESTRAAAKIYWLVGHSLTLEPGINLPLLEPRSLITLLCMPTMPVVAALLPTPPTPGVGSFAAQESTRFRVTIRDQKRQPRLGQQPPLLARCYHSAPRQG